MKPLCDNEENVLRGNYYEALMQKCKVMCFKEEAGSGGLLSMFYACINIVWEYDLCLGECYSTNATHMYSQALQVYGHLREFYSMDVSNMFS